MIGPLFYEYKIFLHQHCQLNTSHEFSTIPCPCQTLHTCSRNTHPPYTTHSLVVSLIFVLVGSVYWQEHSPQAVLV